MTAKDDFGNGSDSDDFDSSPVKFHEQKSGSLSKSIKIYDIDEDPKKQN